MRSSSVKRTIVSETRRTETHATRRTQADWSRARHRRVASPRETETGDGLPCPRTDFPAGQSVFPPPSPPRTSPSTIRNVYVRVPHVKFSFNGFRKYASTPAQRNLKTHCDMYACRGGNAYNIGKGPVSRLRGVGVKFSKIFKRIVFLLFYFFFWGGNFSFYPKTKGRGRYNVQRIRQPQLFCTYYTQTFSPTNKTIYIYIYHWNRWYIVQQGYNITRYNVVSSVGTYLDDYLLLFQFI